MPSANRDNLSKTYQFIDRLRTRSGTNLWGGLERTLELEAFTIALISDGDPSRGITNPHQIIALTEHRNTSHTRIMAMGLGQGHSDNGVRLLKRLIDAHSGQLLLIESDACKEAADCTAGNDGD